MEVLALDEADLLLSFGFEDDIKAIAGELPNICQVFYFSKVLFTATLYSKYTRSLTCENFCCQTLLMSATLGEDIDKLKALVMHNPVTLKLEEEEGKEGQLTQFSLRCSEGVAQIVKSQSPRAPF